MCFLMKTTRISWKGINNFVEKSDVRTGRIVFIFFSADRQLQILTFFVAFLAKTTYRLQTCLSFNSVVKDICSYIYNTPSRIFKSKVDVIAADSSDEDEADDAEEKMQVC